MISSTKLKWARFILFLAAIYNIFWGALISLDPQIILFDDTASVFMLIVLRCVGMLVGVYGIAYYFASRHPEKYWPLILVGFIGKILGPIGAFYYVWTGGLKPGFLMVNVFNDLIWLFPFGWVIYQALTGRLSVTIDEDRSLYQKFLGAAFEEMSPNLKAFHRSKGTIRVLGEFKVTRGAHFINRLMANAADLPAETNVGEAELIVKPYSNREIWSRRIGDKQVTSKQWLEDGFLVERFKVINVYLTAQVVNGDLTIKDAAATVLGIPMPPFFTPTVYAAGTDTGDGIMIDVEIGFKPFGRIINYRGVVKIVKQEVPA